MNPVFLAMGIRGTALLLMLVFLTLCANRLRVSRAHLVAYLVLGLLVTSSMVATFISSTTVPLIYAFFFCLTALVVLQISDDDARHMVADASNIFYVFVSMAAVGVVYHLLGGQPIFSLENADGRSNYFYLSTFSNAETFTIRPSAIFDEPGTFSFYICVLVVLRSRLGLSIWGSTVLLFGGMLTQSITHVLFTLLWFIWAIGRQELSADNERQTIIRRIGLAITFVVLSAVVYQSGILEWSFERIIFYGDNPLSNPRQRSFDNIVNMAIKQPNDVWFGFDASCIQRLPGCTEIGENPLTPLVYGGLLVAWPFYLFLIFAIASVFVSRSGLLLIGAAILLLQRPYLLEFPYSALFSLGYVIWFSSSPGNVGRSVSVQN